MHRLMKGLGGALLFAAALGAATIPRAALAASAAEIDRGVSKTLKNLYAKNAAAKSLGANANGILVFPSIVKGGFVVGGQYGEGALREGGRTVGYYSSVAASTVSRLACKSSDTRFSSCLRAPSTTRRKPVAGRLE